MKGKSVTLRPRVGRVNFREIFREKTRGHNAGRGRRTIDTRNNVPTHTHARCSGTPSTLTCVYAGEMNEAAAAQAFTRVLLLFLLRDNEVRELETYFQGPPRAGGCWKLLLTFRPFTKQRFN